MIKELNIIKQKKKDNDNERSQLYHEEEQIITLLEGRYFRNTNYVFKLKNGRSFAKGVMITFEDNPKIETDAWVGFFDDTVEISLQEFEIEYQKAIEKIRKQIYTHD